MSRAEGNFVEVFAPADLASMSELAFLRGQIASVEGKLFEGDRCVVFYGSETCLIRDLHGSMS